MPIINKDTGISLSLAIAIVGGLIFFASILYSIDRRLYTIEMLGEDRWTATMQERFTIELEKRNRSIGLVVPDVYAIKQANQLPMSYGEESAPFGTSAWAYEPKKVVNP